MDSIERAIRKKKKAMRIKLATAVALFAAVVLIAVRVLGGGERETAPDGSATGLPEETGLSAQISCDGGSVTHGSDAPVTDSRSPGEATAVSAPETASGKATSTPAEGTTYAYAYAGFNPCVVNTDIAEWWLLLVNRDNMLPEDYTATLAEAAPGTGVNLDARAASHYTQMYKAAAKDGVTLTPLSGHRRISTQKKNFENKISYYQNKGYSKAEATQLAAQIILPPGTSEHNAGLAMDICSLEVSFENSDEFAWLSKSAADYGFILRYPKDKTDITKITYEPWHWRYVGVEDAKKIKALGVCLEEYLEMR